MWKGPSADYLLALRDPVACRLHRRAGEQSIAYDLATDGRSALVYRMEKRGEDWHFVTLGTSYGGDAINTCVNAALEFTEHDSELYSLIARDIERRTNEVDLGFHEWQKSLQNLMNTLSDSLSTLRPRHVRA